jgi:hypothetical protein
MMVDEAQADTNTGINAVATIFFIIDGVPSLALVCHIVKYWLHVQDHQANRKNQGCTALSRVKQRPIKKIGRKLFELQALSGLA